MKKFLVLFFLLFSFNVYAGELDRDYLVIGGYKNNYNDSVIIGTINNITFYNDGRVLTGTTYDVSKDKDLSVILYKDGNNLSIVSNEDIILPEDSSYLFAKLKDATVDFNDSVDTSLVKNMNYMFDNYCYNIANCSLELSGFNNVSSMKYTFQGMGYNSTSVILDLNNINTKNVTNMSGLFKTLGYKASNVVIKGLDKFDTSNVTDMNNMFNYTALNTLEFSIDLSNWNVAKVENVSGMFSYLANKKATVFSIGDLSLWDTSSVTDMSNMFDHTGRVSNTFDIGNISKWNTSSVTDMSGMFSYIGGKNGSVIDASGWDTKKVTNFNNMFKGSDYISELYLDNFVINGTMVDMLTGLNRLEIIGLGDNYNTLKDLMSNPNSAYLTGVTGNWYKINKTSVDVTNINEKGYYYAYMPYLVTYKDSNGNILGTSIKPYNKSIILGLKFEDKIESITTKFNESSNDILSKKTTKYTLGTFDKYASGYEYTINEDLDIITSKIETVTSEEITLPVLSKKGYKFLGWSKDGVLLSKYTPLENSTLKAEWEVMIPETGDNVIGYIIVGGLFAVGLLVLILYVKKDH